MTNVKNYWASVRGQMDKLPEGDLYIMSIDDPSVGSVGGVISHVPRHLAARQMVEKIARLATPEEIAEYKTSQRNLAVQIAQKNREYLMASNPFAALESSQLAAAAAEKAAADKKK